MTLLALTLVTLGQVAVKNQPDFAEMKKVMVEARAKRPRDTRALLAIKTGPIAPTLADDLQKYDWAEAGNWMYVQKEWSPNYELDELFQYHFHRFIEGGWVLNYSFNINRLHPEKMEVTHTNFVVPLAVSFKVKKVGKDTYLEESAYGEKTVHRVVQYENGVLIVDISYDGKPNSKMVRFRDVRVAIPRLFESKLD